MNFLKILKSSITPSFSTKKSIEQLSYYDNRLETFKNHSYPHFHPTLSISKFLSEYEHLRKSKQQSQNQQKVMGRVTTIRVHGKTTFIDIRQEHTKLQIAVIQSVKNSLIHRGDIIGVQGNAFLTKKGELSVKASKLQIISPCLWMLPEYQSLKDAEIRYRNKHLDLMTNKQSMQILKKRSKIVSALRKFLQKQEYVEVQTPTLSNSCGGAIAKPFETFHNDYRMNLYMRIAPQLYLKKLMIGGLSKVFEIGKNFRNESVDQTHNPQFTSCELYCANATYEDLIKMTYQLINHVAIQVNGTTIIKIGEEKEIDLSQPWKQVDFIEGLEQKLNIKLPITFEQSETLKFYDDLCKNNDVNCDEPRTIQRLLDKLCEKFLENSLQPLVIKNHPKVMSPLAKSIPQKPHLTQRFQFFINSWEIVNSYTQLNNPHIQKINTPSQIQYVQALQYGLVPCAGWGIGLDRLVMLLTNKQRIQQVLAFPLLRDQKSE